MSGSAAGHHHLVNRRERDAFVHTFTGCALIFGLLEGIRTGSVPRGVGEGIFFGLFMGALGALALRLRRSSGAPIGDTGQHRSLELPDPPAVVLPRAAEALADVSAGPVRVDDDEAVTKTPMTWRDWGRRVSVRVEERGSGSRAEIRSRSRYPLQDIDKGESEQAVDLVAARLDGRRTDPVGSAAD